MPVLRLLLATPVLIVAILAAAWGMGAVPPLGPLLDPAGGVWQAARTSAEHPRRAAADIPGLGGDVHVVYDDRGVPHIFAATMEDAYRALGYVVARDRLFQLEVQARAGAGTLTELVGARLLPADRMTRELGLAAAAERKLAVLDSGGPGWTAIHAYADGVNAYIDRMRVRDIPLEYRLLGQRPARWEPINSLHLLNRMGYTLSYRPTELMRLRSASMVGWEATNALFPYHSPLQEPIRPGPLPTPRLHSPELPPPGAGSEEAGESVRLLETAFGRLFRDPDQALALGSNNWAVSPRRTAGGHALLAGDPHLELTLPAIWYEVHIVVPGEMDVYGVTVPGAPWVIIGFNRDIAWTFTNHDADVTDFYDEEVDDPGHPTQYRLDGEWLPLELRIERYRSAERGGRTFATDTIRYTHRGPMRRAGDRWLSMRWTLHDAWTDENVFPDVARARSVDEFLAAMDDWVAPSQNMLVTDRSGSIAIRSTGHYPVRPDGRRGDVIFDGRTRASDWTGYRPLSEYPFARDPAQGFLASANQQAVDPAEWDEYLGSAWPSPWRAMRINALLRADSAVTPAAMRDYQTDAGSARADLFVPAFLAAAERAALEGDTDARAAGALLSEWDRRYTWENRRAVLFEYAMEELSNRTWDELIPPGGSRPAANPGDVMLAVLLEDPDSPWWNDRRTRPVERRDDILVASLTAAHRRALRHGDPAGDGWRWEELRHANIYHLLQLPGWSAVDVRVQGGPGLLNPSFGRGTHGASWRMVVEMGQEPRAWTIYPGGQSGDPRSRYFADRVAEWSAGLLEEALVPRRAEDMPSRRVIAELRLTGSAR